MTTLEILNILQHDIHSTVWTSRVCPVGCISPEASRKIDAAHCLHCGNCLRICPVKAVEKLGA